MKKNYFLITFFAMAISMYGQPQFTVSDCFQVNDSSKIGFSIFTQSFEDYISQTGNNYTWNFSNENWTEPTVPYLFQPSVESIHTLFHNTEINEYGNVMFPRDMFYTHSENLDTLYFDGLYTSTNYLYAPRIPYLSFPLDYQDSVSVYLQQFANPNQPNTPTGSVTRYWIYDGFGSLQLPYGIISNVFRIRTWQLDSVYVLNSGAVAEELIWFKKDDGIPVLRFQKNATIINAYYATTSSTSGIYEPGIALNSSVYPNPSNGMVTLSTNPSRSGDLYHVYNSNGQEILSGLIQETTEQIDFSSFPKGLYYIRVGDSGSVINTSKVLIAR
jgi:hypothetical protein